MEFLFLLAGLVLGFAIAWFMKKPDPKEQEQLKQRIQELLLQKSSAESARDHIAEERVRSIEESKFQAAEILKLNTGLASSTSENKFLGEKLIEQKAELERIQEKFRIEFENLANKILEEKSRKFTEQNKTNLDEILKPFHERIREFESKVDKTYKAESDERLVLKTEIVKLIELNKKISDDANNLALALKGDNKQQGDWGELILERVLERSGLQEGVEYRKQVVTTNAEEERIKPDFVIMLPDDKHIIIDSKVSLTAYNLCVNADSDEDRERYLWQHIDSVKTHVKQLSDKNYASAKGLDSPDFVLMFIPIESSFSLVFQADAEIFNFAWDKHIVIVSPTTLLATLRTIASIWKQERQARNYMEIVSQAGALYEKFKGFVDDLHEVGRKMDDSKKYYEEAMKKLSSGSGNLVRRVENLKTLGAKTNKQLPPNYIDRSLEE